MKKLLSLAVATTMMASLFSGCSPSTQESSKDQNNYSTQNSSTAQDSNSNNPPAAPSGETVTLKVWGSQEDQDILKNMCEAFAAKNSENTYTFEYGVVGEPDTRARYSEDPAAAADVFAFASDQLRDFVNSSSLYEVTRNKDDIVSRNVSGSVEAATLNDTLYAYPMTADNGYFMYYDKSVFSEDDVKSLDTMLEVAQSEGKKVFMDVSNGWYIASFFLGNGCTIGVDENGKQLCDFNNAKGLEAAEGIKAFTAHPAFITGDDSILLGGMGTSIAAGVSGTWNADSMLEILGDNYGATKLPEYTANGKSIQMASFGGYKLIGVNSLSDYPVHAMDLADWLTNEENQVKRFETRAIGPSNIKAGESDSVKANAALSALAEQNQYAYPQNDVLGGFWTPAEAFGQAMEAKDYSTPLQDMLDNMVNQIIME